MSCLREKMKEEFIQLLKNSGEWFPVVERDICFLVRDLILQGGKSEKYNLALGKDIPPVGDAIVKGYVFSPKLDAINTTKALQELMTQNGCKSLLKISSGCIKKAQELHEFLKNNQTASKENLLKFKELWSRLASYLLIVVFAERLLELKVEELIKQKVGIIDKRYYENIAYVEKFNQNTQELIDLLKLCSEIKGNNYSLEDDFVKEKIKLHVDEYGWLGTRWKFERSWDYDEIKLRLENYLGENPDLELKNVLSPREEAEEITLEFIEKYSLNDDEKDLIKVVKEFVYLRTFRTESLAHANFLFKPILDIIAKEYGYTLSELSDLSVDELISIVEDKKDYKKIISDRKQNGYYMILHNDMIETFVGDERKLVDDTKIFSLPDINNKEIRGQIAWKGKVKGRVKIVAGEEDIVKVQKGDILVTEMTSPDYIPFMKKAIAIVTDEGGATCHAAIVARELGIPCVIGTKIATKVFKDGDFVEVDATNGVVKIIK